MINIAKPPYALTADSKELVPYKCMPVFLWNHDRLPPNAVGVIDFYTEHFFDQPVTIYSINPLVTKRRGHQIAEWIELCENRDWNTHRLQKLYLTNIVADELQDTKEYLDYYFFEYLRSQRYFRSYGFTHFLWFSENSNLDKVTAIYKKSRQLYELRENTLLVKEKSYGEFPTEAAMYIGGWYFLDRELIISDEQENYNHFI